VTDTGRRVGGWLGETAAGLARGVHAGIRWPDHRVQQVQRGTLRTLVLSQALGGLGMSIGIAVSALLAAEVSGSERLAGLAQTLDTDSAASCTTFVYYSASGELLQPRGHGPWTVVGCGSPGSAVTWTCVDRGIRG
jgi:hypothetical protein